ncbi:exodeoxyribonuclease VII large subunit [Chitinophaga vietnamensis]|uniref:exodeoxyribonuclease VII large subunit n=1 Tax=Chitinophaga vietnamensis TaxID=2593957 RepID=UPI001178851E|nr:exodeoxyribonuclease VII large subunit [Chitinophaga vietnamensis]
MNPSIRLSELTNRIQQALNSAFAGQTYWVLADITSHNFYQQKGYHYFDLVEKEAHSTHIIAKVAAAAWGTGAQRIREFETITGQQFRNDIHVLVKVSVSYHQVHGLQVSLLDIDTSYTIGQLEQQKQQVLQRLLLENPDHIRKVGDRFITRNNQLPLPVVIQRIAVVSSGNSAGYQDFRHTLDHNGFGYTFIIDPYFTVVQGEANADLVQQRMVDVYSSGKPYDVVVIIRGGGAQTDFLLFDTYQLGRVVARFPIPVITGIGHQKNETVADMMAHTPTKTPTKAAELIIAHNKLFEDGIQHLQRDILIRSQQLLATHNKALTALHSVVVNQSRTLLAAHKENLLQHRHVLRQHAQQLLFGQRQQLSELSAAIAAKPRLIVSNKLNNLSNIVANIRSFSRNLLQHRQAALQQQETLFRVMSPDNILRRGFAIVYHDHHIVNDASGINAGSHIRVELQDASLEASVTSKTNHDERRTDI